MSLPAAQEKLHLLSEEAGGQGVEDGVKGAVDWKNENHHPGVYCSCRDKDNRRIMLNSGFVAHLARDNWVIFRNQCHFCTKEKKKMYPFFFLLYSGDRTFGNPFQNL